MNFRLLAVGLLAIVPLWAQAQLVNGMRAVVHDTPMTVFEVDAMSVSAIQTLEKTYGDNEALLRKKVEETKADNLDQLVQRQLVCRNIRGFNVPETLLDKDVNKRIEDDIRETLSGDRMRFVKTLQAEGITLEKYRQRIRDQIVIVALRQRNVSSEIIISPTRFRRFTRHTKKIIKLKRK